jgi:hypothetical protein
MAETRQTQPRQQTTGPAPRVEPDHDHHGQSVASWTAVGIILVGCLLMSIAVAIAQTWLFVVGAVVVVVGCVAGKVLSAMGFGVSGKPGT